MVTAPQVTLAIQVDATIEVVTLPSVELAFVVYLVRFADAIEAIACCTDQQAFIVFRQRVDTRCQPVGEGVAMKVVMLVIVADQTSRTAYPQSPAFVDEQCGYLVVNKCCRVVATMEIGGEAVAVELVQSVLGANPHKTISVLADTGNQTARQPV